MPAAPDEAPFADDEIEETFGDLRWRGLPPGVVVAVSGGSDSLGLLLLLKLWRDRRLARGDDVPPILTATVDHRLRPEGAAEAQVVERIAGEWGFEHATLVWDGSKPATGIQEAAREARYGLLVGEAKRRGYAVVLTAHTLDDQAETFLMRLAKGSGLKGLTGMIPGSSRKGIVIDRPLLEVPRSRLRALLQREGVTWIEDPSNSDPRYLRPRLRRLMPLLAAEGIDIRAIGLVTRKLWRADLVVEKLVHRFMHEHVFVRTRGTGGASREDDWRPYHFWKRDVAPTTSIDRSETRILMPADGFSDEPIEVRIRILDLAIRTVRPATHPPGDAQLEQLVLSIADSFRGLKPMRRNLAGALIALRGGTIRISPEPPRRGSASPERGLKSPRSP